MTFTIGFDNLEDHDALVVRSVLKLRSESWNWVDAVAAADVWLVDLTRGLLATPRAALLDAKIIQLVDAGTPATATGAAGLLLKPVKPARLMRLLDAAVARGRPAVAPTEKSAASPAVPPPAAPATPMRAAADAPAPHPFRGRRLRFLRSPNLARYPVTAEMLGLVERMTQVAVAYGALERLLPLDLKLIDEILADATREGYLVDGDGVPLPPLEKPARKGFRLFK